MDKQQKEAVVALERIQMRMEFSSMVRDGVIDLFKKGESLDKAALQSLTEALNKSAKEDEKDYEIVKKHFDEIFVLEVDTN